MTEPQKLKHIFGPVPSRRLGRSLGIDTIPFKICSYDCIYCQLGKTTTKTLERKEYIPYDEILADVDRKLAEDCEFDYITFSGSGEPTLFSRIGELIEAVKKRTNKPLAVLTNGSLLWDDEVREALLPADLVVPSLDAGDQSFFEQINRPCTGLSFDKMTEGLEKFARQFKGKLWLELFFLADPFDPRGQAVKMTDYVRRISPSLVQLNTVARPPCESCARPVLKETMEEILKLFPQPAEIIADFSLTQNRPEKASNRDDILNLLQRRPCTSQDIAKSLSVHHIETLKFLEELIAMKLVEVIDINNKVFYQAVKLEPSDKKL